ncbi:hypothetical protein LQ356_01840 [Metamycoplasma faucium]|uniref:Uncharacterized protein n=1 Tax=Metamycoplasma faucium TaxID=56142 RepID=A0ABZ2TKP0_9BACT
MKQSDFQQFLIEQFEKQNKFNEQQLKFNEFVTHEFAERRKFNELFSNCLDSIKNRLTRLESFHKKLLK